MKKIGTITVPENTKAILWDMDGVLVDSLTHDLEVVNELLAKYAGARAFVPHDCIRSVFAYDVPKFWELIIENVHEARGVVIPERDRARLIDEYSLTRRDARFPILPGVVGVLEAARKAGLKNAVVSNNSTNEVRRILDRAALLGFFDLVVGNDGLRDSEKKPSPVMYQRALQGLALRPVETVVVEDTPVGAEAGKRAECFVIGIATGGARREELVASRFVDRVYENLAPQRALQIVQTAKKDVEAAEQLTLEYVQDINPMLGAESVKIQQSNVSLNSVNGFVVAGDKEYFFKFHSEENEEMLGSEYYNARLLADLGLPVVAPIFVNQEPGLQFVLYEKIVAPTAFELYEKEGRIEMLLEAETELCRKISDAYSKTLALTSADDVAKSSLNQLFFNRLVSASAPRLRSYYLDKNVMLPDGSTIPFEKLAKMRWVINGVQYEETLAQIIAEAKTLLDPRKEGKTATVVGHGDDHNGNKFFISGAFVLFDPAFAGVQPALLSFVKATVHNTLLHPYWLYDSKRLEGQLQLEVTLERDEIIVTHNWDIKKRAPFRLDILNLYADEVWKPLLAELTRRGWLPADWKDCLRAAFFCCPFLVKNLIDPGAYSPAASLLALSKCVELGSRADAETIVEKFLTRIDPKNV
jgi:HAD superfamily hydrolase (TIGR01509 family)